MFRKRVIPWLVGAMLLSLWSGAALGSHGYVHGYCKDGQPVIEEWPDKDFIPVCDGDTLVLDSERGDVPVYDAVDLVPPPDFYAWADVLLNDKMLVNPYRDAFPFVVKSTGRTVIPIRMVTEAMGGTATWNEETREVTIRLGDKYMVMSIGSTAAVANGKSVTLDQPPMLWLDRTMVPLRVLVEAFGATVNWTDESKIVEIILPGVKCREGYCSWMSP